MEVLVVPNSKKQAVQEMENGVVKVWVSSPPERGKANKEVIKIVKRHFGFENIKIIRGFNSRRKLLVCE